MKEYEIVNEILNSNYCLLSATEKMCFKWGWESCEKNLALDKKENRQLKIYSVLINHITKNEKEVLEEVKIIAESEEQVLKWIRLNFVITKQPEINIIERNK